MKSQRILIAALATLFVCGARANLATDLPVLPDDKAQAAINTANIISMKRDGFRPDRDIILALTSDEEGDGNNTDRKNE